MNLYWNNIFESEYTIRRKEVDKAAEEEKKRKQTEAHKKQQVPDQY